MDNRRKERLPADLTGREIEGMEEVRGPAVPGEEPVRSEK